MIRIDHKKCDLCLDCHESCKKHGLMFDGGCVFVSLDCDSCGECVKVCKRKAIYLDDSMEKEKIAIDIDFYENRGYFKAWLRNLKRFFRSSSSREADTSSGQVRAENLNASRSATVNGSKFQGLSFGTGDFSAKSMQMKSRTSIQNIRKESVCCGGSRGQA